MGSVVAGASSLEIDSIPDQNVSIGDYVELTVSATGSDPSLIEYDIVNKPSDASFDPETGEFSWVPESSGEYGMQFSATDGNSTATEDVTIVVTAAPNNAPVIKVPGSETVEVGQYLSFTIEARDKDKDELTFSMSSPPSSGAIIDPASGKFEWTPAAGEAGTYDVEFAVSDGSESDTGSVTITVTEASSGEDEPGSNATLVMAAISPKTVAVNDTLQFTVSASGGNGALLFSASSLPSGAEFDTTTQVFKWTPSASQVAQYSFLFTVTDGVNSDTGTASVKVIAADNPSTDSSGSSGDSGGSGGSGGSSSGSSGSGGGSFQASKEKYENIEFKDFSIKYVLRDVENVFNFSMENNSIKSVVIVTLLNEGETKTIIEMLKGTSTMAKKAPPGIVYRNVNIWVGDEKFSSSKLKTAMVEFKVEKSWLSEKSIDPASVKLLRYSGSWNYLPTSITGEDETYVHYAAYTSGFSVFAISSVNESDFAPTGEQNVSQDNENISHSVGDEEGSAAVPVTQNGRSSKYILFALVGMAGLGAIGYRYREQANEILSKLGNSDGKRYRRIRK
ncbi:PGF-pre-PGF domain-containing protein [Methanolobus chelungpuianus]|uniref:PGF-pre-PGF domain-containing protein n=1 Tax=Methanolobus chelungpuianus TaxID=502115 RepID=UPI00211472B3|nr:PGF-pre-PGF domain-containing protein [Methanolobus chelungpuianus]